MAAAPSPGPCHARVIGEVLHQPFLEQQAVMSRSTEQDYEFVKISSEVISFQAFIHFLLAITYHSVNLLLLLFCGLTTF